MLLVFERINANFIFERKLGSDDIRRLFQRYAVHSSRLSYSGADGRHICHKRKLGVVSVRQYYESKWEANALSSSIVIDTFFRYSSIFAASEYRHDFANLFGNTAYISVARYLDADIINSRSVQYPSAWSKHNGSVHRLHSRLRDRTFGQWRHYADERLYVYNKAFEYTLKIIKTCYKRNVQMWAV